MKQKFPLHKILPLAKKLESKIREACVKCQIAGSIRREKSEVSDIELVVIPQRVQTGLFGESSRSPKFTNIFRKWRPEKGDPIKGKYLRLTWKTSLGEIPIDIFIADQGNFGNILWTRTGSTNYTIAAIKAAKEKGILFIDGRVEKGDKIQEIPDEQEFFSITNLPYVAPQNR